MMGPVFFTSSILRVPERLLLRGGRWQKLPLRVRIGYLHHPTLGHCLIDTGYRTPMTPAGVQPDFHLRMYKRLFRPSTVCADPIGAGLARVGVRRDQISTVIVTHFHADHIGGLVDLPGARVLAPLQAWRAMTRNSAMRNAMAGVFRQLLPDDIENRLGFFEDAALVDAPFGLGPARDIAGDGSLLAVDLPGHHAGHAGLCFPQADRPLLYAVDAQWKLAAILQDRCPGFPANLVAHDRAALKQTVRRVQEFASRGGEVVLCHDPNPHRLDMDAQVWR